MAGVLSNQGCPIVDTDGDGVADDQDKCPSVAGVLSNQGCPIIDTDGDGVTDDQDKCPSVAGVMSNQGCPIIDTDGDGVTDDQDKCPNLAGSMSNQGCPDSIAPRKDSTKKTIVGKIPNVIVYFDTDKFNIRPEANVSIQKAIRFLKDNPLFIVILKGHTDTRGNIEYNEKLSEKRVSAVRQVLMRNGISVSRVQVSHFGEMSPAEKEMGAIQLFKNRRVEFAFIEDSLSK